MPTVQWPLEEGGPERLEAAWRGSFMDPYADFALHLDGATVLTATGSKELRTGRSVELPEGAGTVIAQVSGGHLRVSHNGSPLLWADRTEEARHYAMLAVGFVGLVNTGMGMYAVLFPSPRWQTLGFGWLTLAVGILFLALSVAVYRNSLPALLVATVLFSADFVMTVVSIIGGAPGNVGLILIRAILLACMVSGVLKLWKARGKLP
jgi:hypothetical protein